MALKDFLRGAVKKMLAAKGADSGPDRSGDDETQDKVLKSLRREQRTQMELVEKVRLRKEIAEFKRKETSKNVFGSPGDAVLNEGKRVIPAGSVKQSFFGKSRI